MGNGDSPTASSGGSDDERMPVAPGTIEIPKVPVVAIGASAGGLEPLEQFFDAIKDKSNNAFVVIQHLSPNFESMMDELLSRHSGMEIRRVVDGMVLLPNTIYLNPPRTEMKMENGRFKLRELNDETHINLPIDAFFFSIAAQYGKDAIAIVLSGTGSDGTKGSATIREAGGTVIAQDPASAKFESMPSSVISKGYADAIGLPEEMSDYILKIRAGLPIAAITSPEDGGDPILRIFKQLRERFGTEFGYYKKATIERRLRRRSDMRNVTLEDYANIIAIDAEETEALYADLLIEVTSFFRDREAYDVVRREVIPQLAATMSNTRPVRIWVPGCASGEEAYSLAILMADYAVQNGLKLNLKILATDIHHRSLDAASRGIYPEDSVRRLSDQQVERYFDVAPDGTHQVKSSLRQMVVFSPHNVLKDPPFTKMNMISCRNVLIYFNDVAQQKSLAFFHFALAKDGVLFLGPSESTGKLQNEFSTVDQKWRIFQKKRDVRLADSVSLLPTNENATAFFGSSSQVDRLQTISPTSPVAGPARQAHGEALKEMLRLYAPTGFLLARDGTIVHVLGDAGDFLAVNNGTFSSRITEMVQEDLKLIISTGLERLKTIDTFEFERRVSMTDADGAASVVVVTIKALVEPGNVRNYLLLTLDRIEDRPASSSDLLQVLPLAQSEATDIMRVRIQDLERDLRATEESLQSTIEEIETSNEELQATNEELMASNEELQSTNEELHSVNEELYTVSAEHQRKIEELTELTDDMDHLLKATDIGIIFVDADRTIRRFTPSASATFNLLPQDVGRPIEHITARFKAVDFVDLITGVMVDETACEREVVVDGSTYMLRILPYKTSLTDDVGAVVTMIDISELKAAQKSETDTARLYGEIVSDISDFILRWDARSKRVTYCNQVFADSIDQQVADIVGCDYEAFLPGEQTSEIIHDINKLPAGETRSFEVVASDRNGNLDVRSSTVRAMAGDDGQVAAYQITGRDNTRPYKYRKALEALNHVAKIEGAGYDAALKRILEIGSQYLEMCCGVVARIDETGLTCIKGSGPGTEPGDRAVPIEETFFAAFGKRQSTVVEAHLSAGDAALRQKLPDDMESLLAARIYTGAAQFGALAFHDPEPRSEPFRDEQIAFIQLLASTVGHLIERDEQLKDIRTRQRHYEEIFNQSPVMICTIAADGEILTLNDEFASALETARETLVGTRLQSLIEPDVPDKLTGMLDDSAASGTHLRKTQCDFRTGLDDVLTVELSAAPQANEHGRGVQFLVVMEDVSQRQLAQHEVERQKKELEDANEGLSRFAYIASHDLQEPLRKIRQFGDLLTSDCKDALDEDGHYYVDVMTGSAARISNLVADLLAYSGAAEKEFELVEVDLGGVVKDVLNELVTAIDGSGAKVSVGKLPVVKADEVAAGQLFQNLISNAIKYRQSDVAPVIQVTSRKHRSKTVIKVKDNGIGMQNDRDRNIFEPFVRLEKRARFEGSGIGLAICKTVCDRLGWTIAYDSQLGEGTVFTVTIPAAR